MQNLRYVGKNLFIEKLSINNILKRNKTPFYLYSENQIINNFLKFKKVFKKSNPLICFAAKSNSNVAILKTLGKLGAGTDVVSGGELTFLITLTCSSLTRLLQRNSSRLVKD